MTSPTTKNSRPARGRATAGLTLVELLVVISIIGLLMTIGVGVWIKFKRSATGQEGYSRLATVVRRAKIFAQEESSGARVVIDAQNHSFYAEGMRLLGCWQLEGPPPGKTGAAEEGFAGRPIIVSGGAYKIKDASGNLQPVAGYHGGGVLFTGPGSLIMEDDAYLFPSGGELSCCIFPTTDSLAANQRQILFSRGKELELAISNLNGELEAKCGGATISTVGYRLPILRWSRVSFFFSPRELTITVDGVVRGRVSPGDLPSKKDDNAPVVFGSEGARCFPFTGVVDEVTIRRVVREAQYTLPGQLELISPVSEIHFDGAGTLDRRFHAGEIKLGIKREESSAPDGSVTRWVRVALNGEISEE